jgi:hypothetical protein
MPETVSALILEVSASAVPDMMERLTAFLLRRQYGFVQTFNPGDTRHTTFEIFPAQAQPGLRLTLQATESGASPPLIHPPADVAALSSETAALLQRLLEVLNAHTGEVQRTEGKS